MGYVINSKITEGVNLFYKDRPVPNEVIKNETMFFNADMDYAYDHGGPLTQKFIDKLPLEWQCDNPVIDSRVHMLMKGWYPCIPGWHHDDVPRSRSDGQPNYDAPEYKSEHVMALINGDICPTQFALGQFTMPDVPLGGTIYKDWHAEVEQHLHHGAADLIEAPSNKLIFFDWLTFHQGQRAVKDGWRWFIRASRNTHRKPTNEIRRQVQVYLEFPNDGW